MFGFSYKDAADVHSTNDIIVDEDLDGRWIPLDANPNRLIAVGITNDRFYAKNILENYRNSLDRLHHQHQEFRTHELNTIMRNTINIRNYLNRFNDSDSFNIGHNVHGKYGSFSLPLNI